MKTFTKMLFMALILTISTTLFAQKSIHSFVGNSAPDKMEMTRQVLGYNNVTVPLTPEGMTRAVGDDCTNPIVISTLPFYDENQTTIGRGNTYDETCLNDYDSGEDIIYRLEIALSVTINVHLDPLGTGYTGMALSDGCPLSSLCLAMSYDLSGNQEPHSFTVSLDPGVYYIMVDTWAYPDNIEAFNLLITEVETVPNDFCESAIEIGEVINYPFSTIYATDDPSGETDGPEIWFNYKAGFTGYAVIDLCGSDYDTHLIVWDGVDCPPATMIKDVDDGCGYSGLQSKGIIEVVEGNIYKLEIGGFSGDTGDGLLSIYEYEECNLECPPLGIDENEPCGEDINGGCNMVTPAFTNVSNGNIICGNLWSEFGIRDTDWFEVKLNGPGSIKMIVTAEETLIFGLAGQNVLGVPGCENNTGFLSNYKVLSPCQEDSIWVINLPKGTYYLFAAPIDYDLHCPGFSYQAEFEIIELPSGFIKGDVIASDSGLPLEGVKITAGEAVTYTQSLGNYILELPVGTYTVEANGFAIAYSAVTKSDINVVLDDFTTVNFILDPLDAPELLTAVPGIEQVELTWAEIGAKTDGSKIVMGDIFSKNDYIPGTTMNLDFVLSIYSPDFEWGEYAELVFPEEFEIESVGDLNGVSGVIDGQKVSWNGVFYDSDTPQEIDFYVQVNVSGDATGPLVLLYRVEGDGYGLDPHFFEGPVTVYEKNGDYVPTFNVYRRKIIPGTPTYFIPICYGVIGNYYFDEIFLGGDEWCYYVTQIMPDKSESPASNVLCATPLIRPGSMCEHAIDYGEVNSSAMNESLVRETDVRWFEFDVPYTMDIAVRLYNTNFDADVILYSDCDGTLLEDSDFCGGAEYDIEKIYSLLPGGTYYAMVFGNEEEFGDFEIFITQVQVFTIREGWSGISTYMNPSGDLNIASQLACFEENMIITIRPTPYGIWWPSQNINTLGDFSSMIGYKSKMEIEMTTVIYGTENPDKTVVLPANASYLPVRVTAPTSTDDLKNQLEGKLLILFDMYDPTAVIWPDGGLDNLEYLVPDHAYMINMFVPAEYTYPMPSTAPAPNFVQPPARVKLEVWNEVINTGQPHFLSLHVDALASLELGDYIGVFNSEGLCVGMVEYTSNENNHFIAAFGNDEYTEEKDGLDDGELMIFKVYRPSNGLVYALEVTYSDKMPDVDGLYKLYGMSMITGMKLGPTAIGEEQFNSLRIYPNPTTGLFNISGLEGDFEVIITNAQGQQIMSLELNGQTTLDLTTQPKGVYFIRFTNENISKITKIVIK